MWTPRDMAESVRHCNMNSGNHLSFLAPSLLLCISFMYDRVGKWLSSLPSDGDLSIDNGYTAAALKLYGL